MRLENIAKSLDSSLGPKGKMLKEEFLVMAAEYIGTTMFLFMGFAAAHTANLPNAASTTSSGTPFTNTANLLYIAFAFGISLVINIWIFFRVSGGIFNPAVALALSLAGAISPVRAVLVSVAQIVGGITAAALIDGLMPGPLNVATTLGENTSIVQGFFLEMFLTAQLIMMIFMLAVEKHKSTFLAPLSIGFTLFVCHLAGIHFTGASLNPARSFGPHVVLGQFPGYHWIYWVGPGLGALVATGLYTFLKVFGYEKVGGAGDRDDTMMVARIVEESVDEGNGDGKVVVAKVVSKSNGASGTV